MSRACWKPEWRDEAGFCVLAMAGEPDCFAGEDGACIVSDPQASWERLVTRAFASSPWKQARAAHPDHRNSGEGEPHG